MQILVEGERVGEFMGGKRFVSFNEDLDGEIYVLGGLQIVSLFAEPDFDNSGSYDASEIDAICGAFGSDSSLYDLNGDLRVDAADIDIMLEFANAVAGDLDLNGTIDLADFIQLQAHFGERSNDTLDSSRRWRGARSLVDQTHWSDGDIDCNGTVDHNDFLTMTGNFGNGHAESLVAIPEPNGIAIALVGLVLITTRRRGSHNRSVRRE
jgi:hypothetical protein